MNFQDRLEEALIKHPNKEDIEFHMRLPKTQPEAVTGLPDEDTWGDIYDQMFELEYEDPQPLDQEKANQILQAGYPIKLQAKLNDQLITQYQIPREKAIIPTYIVKDHNIFATQSFWIRLFIRGDEGDGSPGREGSYENLEEIINTLHDRLAARYDYYQHNYYRNNHSTLVLKYLRKP